MAKWAVKGAKGAANVKGVLGINAAAANMRRAKVYALGLSSSAAPTDTMNLWQVQRSTTAPTGAALTPNALDPADTLASTIVATDTITVDPTLTANAFQLHKAVHCRSTFQWVAPYPGAEIVIPATASAGIQLQIAAATTAVMDGDASFEEQ